MFSKKVQNPFDVLKERIHKRDVAAAYEYLHLFKTRPELDPVMNDLTKAVALVLAEQTDRRVIVEH
jgi:predicted component of viral defense system (DUF524 family)